MHSFTEWFKLPALCFLGLILLFTAPPALAQEYLVSTQHYSVPEGLSNRYVRHAIQDKRGFIWAATYDGINRFDGFEFQQYTRVKDGLSSASCHKIIEGRRGQLWLFYTKPPTEDGNPRGFFLVDLFDPATGLATPFEKAVQAPFPVADIFEVQPGHLGNIYFLLRSGEIYRYDGFAFRRLLKIPSSGTGRLAVSPEGLIGLLNRDSVIQFDSLGRILYRTLLPAACDFLRAANGRFWAGKNNPKSRPAMWSIRAGQPAQPFYFRGSDGRPADFGWDKNYQTPVFPDRLGRWWVFFAGRLSLFDPDGKFLYDFSASLKPNALPYPTFIYFDRRNTAWIGSTNGLLSVSIRKNPFGNYLQSEELIDTRGIVQDEKGQVYVLQQGNTWRLDSGSGAAVNLGIPAWTAAARDAQGRLWFGDYSFIVHFYDPVSGEKKTFFLAGLADKATSNATRALFPDASSGRIWVGTDGRGLAYIDSLDQGITLFVEYNQFQHLQNASIKSFLKDSRGLWLGTNLGLYLLEPGKGVTAEYSRRAGSLPFDDINHIYKDKEGIFWLATNHGGLIRWVKETGNFRQFTQRDGLSNDVVHAVYEDKDGQLWLPSNYGLMRFDKRSFQVNTYLPRDGLPHEEFNYCSHYQAADGRLYFGGLKGVTAFYPEELYRETQQASPSLGISQYQELDGATGAFVDKTPELLAANEIRLPPRNKSFILKIAFPDYQSPKSNRFAYRIEGLHENWVYQPGNAIQANGLPYGSFTLHVKAQGASGRWSARELRLPLKVLRPFYLQGWFLAACLALALFLIWWRIRMLKQAALSLEAEVKKRTLKIEQDKQVIEKQAAGLRELDEMKSRFFTNVAHELRTPLTLILSPLKKLLKDTGPDNPSIATLKLIQSNARGLLRMAEDILDLDKLETRQLQLAEETAVFYPLIRRLVSTFESHAHAEGIELQLNHLPEKYLQLKLDINKIERILYNLLSNALKFTSRGGKVTVTVSDAASSIRIAVADTGRGIHPDDLPRIFDRYYQAQASAPPSPPGGGEERPPQSLQGGKVPEKGSLKRPSSANPAPLGGLRGTRAEGGAGIGLAIASEYAMLMEGKLSVDSQLGTGSTFILEIPKKEVFGNIQSLEAEQPGPEAENSAAGGRQFRSGDTGERQGILIVEDNHDLRHFLREILSPQYEVLVASNGIEALEILNEAAPSLILTDLMMPEMDGFTLIQRLKAEARWQDVPVIVLTARAGLDDKLSVLRIGVDDYLAKPFETEELLARVYNLVLNRQKRLEWHREKQAGPESPPEGKEPYPKLEQLLQSEEALSADRRWLEKVEQAAFQQVGQGSLNPEGLALELAVSSRHLRRKLKQLTGMSTADYLREIRLQKARQLLENKACPTVAEACYAIGLSDFRHFSKIFLQRFGKHPSHYLNENT